MSVGALHKYLDDRDGFVSGVDRGGEGRGHLISPLGVLEAILVREMLDLSCPASTVRDAVRELQTVYESSEDRYTLVLVLSDDRFWISPEQQLVERFDVGQSLASATRTTLVPIGRQLRQAISALEQMPLRGRERR